MAGTPSTKLLVLCTVAVGAIYAGAYMYTEPSAQASGTNASVTGQTTPSTSPQPNSGSTAGSGGQASSSPSSSPSTSASSSSKSSVKYKDGTYTGSGSNSYGDLSVSVKISGGKIASVRITSYSMHYPASYIDPQMNNEVVKMQTYRVYAVSGATASSYNFAEAVYYALQKAKA